MKKHTALVDCFYIAHSPSVHFGSIKTGQTVTTGQGSLEILGTVEAWRRRLIELEVITEKHHFIDDAWQIIEEESENDIY